MLFPGENTLLALSRGFQPPGNALLALSKGLFALIYSISSQFPLHLPPVYMRKRHFAYAYQ